MNYKLSKRYNKGIRLNSLNALLIKSKKMTSCTRYKAYGLTP